MYASKHERKERSVDKNPATGDVETTSPFQRLILEDQIEVWKASRLTGVNKIIGNSVQMIITGRDFITTAICGDSHASLAWAGVLIFHLVCLHAIFACAESLSNAACE